jgi:cob(I)alamin adenosyltransferase
MHLHKIYTRTGDDGTTGLANGSRVSKNDPRIAIVGTLDEANSVLGIAKMHSQGSVSLAIEYMQNALFDLGAVITGSKHFEFNDSDVEYLENEMDRMNEELSPLTSFVLPGGNLLNGYLHLARSIIRNAERSCIDVNINDVVFRYINRLSDYLFVLGRYVARENEVLWIPSRRTL